MTLKPFDEAFSGAETCYGSSMYHPADHRTKAKMRDFITGDVVVVFAIPSPSGALFMIESIF